VRFVRFARATPGGGALPAVARALEQAETRPWGANVDTATAETLILTVRSCDASAEQVLFQRTVRVCVAQLKALAIKEARDVSNQVKPQVNADENPERRRSGPRVCASEC
jgi:hypothetical protein